MQDNKFIRLFNVLIILFICIECSERAYDIKAKVNLVNEYVVENDCIQIDFSFLMMEHKRINFDGFIFLKFYNNIGKVEFMDVHTPLYKINDWLPGLMINYSRCIQVPENIREGEYIVSYGFIDKNRNNRFLRIKQKEFKKGEYYAGKISILKAIYYEGSYGLEKDTNLCEDKTFIWIQKEAKIYITNPHKNIILCIKARAPISYFKGKPQNTIVFINKKRIGTIYFDTNDIINKKLFLKSKKLGKEKFIELEFRSSQEFKPADVFPNSNDKRSLAVQIYSINFEENIK